MNMRLPPLHSMKDKVSMKTKEQVKAFAMDNARKYFAAFQITGGTSDKGWNQQKSGVVHALGINEMFSLKLNKETLAELAAYCTVVSNNAQFGQDLFDSKTAKSTALATDLIELALKK